jgi:hypothetical protein
MWKSVAAVAGGGLCVLLVWATHVSARPETVTGQVVDLYCFEPSTKANSGMDHRQGRECAMACAKWEGQPVGILTADGKVYQLAGGLVANNNANIAPHVSHTVTISGDVVEKDGVQMLTASDLKMVSK